jgi:WD40 repeat protein
VDSAQAIRRFEGEGIPICPDGVAFSPDGGQALVAAEDVPGDSGKTSLVLWDVETGQEIRRFEGHVTYVRAVAFHPDAGTALAGSQSIPDNALGDLILWNLETGEALRRFDISHDVSSIAMSPDGRWALTGSATGFVAILWDVATGQAIRRFEGHTGPVLNVAFGPEDETVLTASYDGSVVLWDIDTGDIIRRYLGHDQPVWALDISPGVPVGRDEHYVISSSEFGTVIIWDFETGKEVRRFRAHSGWAGDVAFSPDGQTAFSVGFDGALVRWQIADPSLDELRDWIRANRYVRELTCEERDLYRVEPLCGPQRAAPTAEP